MTKAFTYAPFAAAGALLFLAIAMARATSALRRSRPSSAQDEDDQSPDELESRH